MVFYRKYRPQLIDELDSAQVREALTAVLSLSDVPHAFLFTGPKGLGKTSTARIFAKAINCPNKKKGSLEPCNVCDICQSITSGSNVDIIEIDGASNRNIDDVRDLKEKIKLSPATVKKKVYIIDEVHMFTTESFNALLKTLEEPPSHAMFILCTTERQKVPATIASRCFTIEFQPASKEELARSFKRIAKGEKLTIEDDAIMEILTLAEGGFRDAHKILEELVGLAPNKAITRELVESKYKVSSSKRYVAAIIESIVAKDTKKSLEILQSLVEQGIDLKTFLVQLVSFLHSIVLQKAGVGGIEVQEIEKVVGTMDELRALLILLTRAYGEMKYAVLPQLPLELAVIEWGSSVVVIPAKAGTQDVERNGSPIKSGMTVNVAVSEQGVTVSSMRKQMGDLARVKALYGEPKPAPKDGTESNDPAIDLTQISNTEITAEWLQHFWNTLVAEIKQSNHTLAGVLRGCTIHSFDKKVLIIVTAYKFHKERLDDSKTRMLLEQVCKTLTGNPISVEVRLKG